MSTKEKIFEAGTFLFRKMGFAATSVQDIASGVGVKPASLYNHIASKHDILEKLLMEGADLFMKGMMEIKNSSLSPIEKIEKLISLHVRLSIDHTDLMALMAVEWRHLEASPRKKYTHLRETYESDFADILREAMSEGQIQEMDVEIAMFSILTTLKWFYSWYDKHSDLSSHDVEKYLVKCLLGGIRKSG